MGLSSLSTGESNDRIPSEVRAPVVSTAAFKQLSEGEAQRALYIDFEGGQDKPPVLLGILGHRGRGAEPSVFQVVVDREFEPAGPMPRGLIDAVETVVQRAEHGDRRIVSWSQHDLDVVRRLHDDQPELVARFEHRYANALGVARRWANRMHPEDRPADGRLVGYLALIGYEIPPGASAGHVGQTIRALRPRLQAGRPLTPAHRRRWARLLEHNRYDCDGMREVCLLATRELADAA